MRALQDLIPHCNKVRSKLYYASFLNSDQVHASPWTDTVMLVSGGISDLSFVDMISLFYLNLLGLLH